MVSDNSPMIIIDHTETPAGATDNMALDTELLNTTTTTLRHYLWSEPSQTIGRITPIPDEADHKIVRRPTGGGLVNHDPHTSQTYALVLPACLFKNQFKSIAHLYQELHQALQSLYPQGSTFLYDPTLKKQGTICFQHYSPHDLIDSATELKLAGAAIRRTKTTLLIQGEMKWDLSEYPPFPKQSFYQSLTRFLESP